MDVIHLAMWVSDLDQSANFYEDVLGLEYDSQFELDGVVNYYVGSEDGAELQFKYDPERTEPIDPSGIDHIALAVDDTDAEFERVMDAANPPVVEEPMDIEAVNRRVAFIEDPDGYVVELVGPL